MGGGFLACSSDRGNRAVSSEQGEEARKRPNQPSWIVRGLQTEVLVAPVLREHRGVEMGGGTNNSHFRPLCLRGCGPPKATVPGACPGVTVRRSTGRGSAADVIQYDPVRTHTTRCGGGRRERGGHGGAGCTIFSGIISSGPALGAEPSGVATSCRQLVENPAKDGDLERQHHEPKSLRQPCVRLLWISSSGKRGMG